MNETVVIIDDDKVVRHIASAVLQAAGYDIKCYESPELALQELAHADSGSISLIISDYIMPEMQGDILIQKLRENPELQKVPFILLTSETTLSFDALTDSDKETSVMIKPFTRDQLLTLVREKIDTPKT